MVVLEYSVRAICRRDSPVVHGSDHQHDDARRPALAVGSCGRGHGFDREHPHPDAPGVSKARAVLEASRQTAVARLLAMLCVLAVFVPSFFMTGVSRQLFVPLSLAVAFSMVASYVLSSTLVPVFSTWLLKEARGDRQGGAFAWLRSVYSRYLDVVLRFRWPLVLVYLAASIGLIYILGPRLGTEIFPKSKASILKVRLVPLRTRVEETERIVLRALNVIQREAGADKVEITSDFVGVAIQLSGGPDSFIHKRSAGSHHPGRAQFQGWEG